jgi:2Fe-2S ferredoxin
MARVRVEPAGFEIEVPPEHTMMAAAVAQGYYWPTTCGGEGRCTTCAVEILEGAEQLSPMGRAERNALSEGRGPGAANSGLRLACQVLLSGDVTVRKAGVRPPGD